MTRTEKITVVLIILLFIAIGGITRSCYNDLKEHGGVRQIIIDVGREIRSITEEINK